MQKKQLRLGIENKVYIPVNAMSSQHKRSTLYMTQIKVDYIQQQIVKDTSEYCLQGRVDARLIRFNKLVRYKLHNFDIMFEMFLEHRT